MRILITNARLISAGGTEMYVYDLAFRLLQRGHTPIVYSPQVGPLAQKFKDATIPVVENLNQLGAIPDIIHGHHGLETVAALLKFPSTPAIYVCHDWGWIADRPPNLARIQQYLAVDETCFDRVTLRDGIAEERVRILQNGVDMHRFKPRDPLPSQLESALVFSNYMTDEHVNQIAAACEELGIRVDAVGRHFGNVEMQPEHLLPSYDVVFAKARCAWEALAVGCSVVVCDANGLGSLVTTKSFKRQRKLNFGRRLLRNKVTTNNIRRELASYSVHDAMKVVRQTRELCDVEKLVDELMKIYRSAIARHGKVRHDVAAEYSAFSDYLTTFSAMRFGPIANAA